MCLSKYHQFYHLVQQNSLPSEFEVQILSIAWKKPLEQGKATARTQLYQKSGNNLNIFRQVAVDGKYDIFGFLK